MTEPNKKISLKKTVIGEDGELIDSEAAPKKRERREGEPKISTRKAVQMRGRLNQGGAVEKKPTHQTKPPYTPKPRYASQPQQTPSVPRADYPARAQRSNDAERAPRTDYPARAPRPDYAERTPRFERPPLALRGFDSRRASYPERSAGNDSRPQPRPTEARYGQARSASQNRSGDQNRGGDQNSYSPRQPEHHQRQSAPYAIQSRGHDQRFGDRNTGAVPPRDYSRDHERYVPRHRRSEQSYEQATREQSVRQDTSANAPSRQYEPRTGGFDSRRHGAPVRQERSVRHERPARYERSASPNPSERTFGSREHVAVNSVQNDQNQGVRLSKRMTELGLSSRREADEWIERGWVSVNGIVVDVLGSRVMLTDEIKVDPQARIQQASWVTVLINKPVGFVSGQAEDGYEPAMVLVTPQNRWAKDDLPLQWNRAQIKHLVPAGRLDIDSTGLLVLTQDGRVAKTLIGENSTVEKEYLVRVERQPHFDEHTALELLRHGLQLDGEPLKPAKVSWQNEDQLRIVLKEGKKRQIRRMCEMVGLFVVGLKRVRIGSINLAALPEGQWRYLRPTERF